jgi:hypothetical protein
MCTCQQYGNVIKYVSAGVAKYGKESYLRLAGKLARKLKSSLLCKSRRKCKDIQRYQWPLPPVTVHRSNQ